MKVWSRLPEKDRRRWLAVATALVVALYGLLVYPRTNRELAQSEAMVARRLDRIERRTDKDMEPGANPGALQSELKRVRETRTGLGTRLDGLAARFADPASETERQTLLLALSTLAESVGLDVMRQGSEGQADESRTAPKLTDPVSGRESVQLRARGGYWQLMDFLAGLPTLASHSAVIGLELQSGEIAPKGEDAAALPPGQLDLTLDLSL